MIVIRTLHNQLASHFSQHRTSARFTSLFGLLSLVLAAGRFGEIGLRMALVLRGALGLILIGLLLGLTLVSLLGSDCRPSSPV